MKETRVVEDRGKTKADLKFISKRTDGRKSEFQEGGLIQF